MLRSGLIMVNKELNKEHALTRVTRNIVNKGLNKEHALTRS